MTGPLDGIRVLEFSHIAAGPYCGRTLADLGAEVIKVEPPAGDAYRRNGSVVPGTSKSYQSYGRGKRSLALDLQDKRALAVIHRLMPGIDVVVTNYRAGVPERIGIGYETLRALRPDLIYLHITGFGPTGPLTSRAASDIVGQAYSGAMAISEKIDEHGAPLTVRSIPVGDITSALAGAMGICAALYHRDATGQGQLINASLMRSAMSLIGDAVMREPRADAVYRDPMLNRINAVRARGGTYEELIAARLDPRDAAIEAARRLFDDGYLAVDGPLVLGATTPEHRAIARRALGIDDEAFDDIEAIERRGLSADEVSRVTVLRDTIEQRLRERSVAEWLAAFRRAGAPAGPVYIPEEVADDEQASLMMVDVDDPVTGMQRQVGPLIEMSKTPPEVAGPAALLGQHKDELLQEAGYSADEIVALRADGTIV